MAAVVVGGKEAENGGKGELNEPEEPLLSTDLVEDPRKAGTRPCHLFRIQSRMNHHAILFRDTNRSSMNSYFSIISFLLTLTLLFLDFWMLVVYSNQPP